MPTLDQHHSLEQARIMVVGDSGTGKTSALACLANAGKRLFILDFDDGLPILRALVKPEFHANITYETLRDKVRVNPTGPYVKGQPDAFNRAMALLDKWVGGCVAGDVIVVDTLTHMGAAAMNWTLALNNRWGKQVRPRDWGQAMARQEAAIQELTGPDVKSDVVVNAHLATLSDGGGGDDDDEDGAKIARKTVDWKRYPSALGKKLPPRIATYFNCVVQTQIIGAGPRAKRVIRTVPEPDVDIKVPVLPGKLPTELPIEDGLLRIMDAIKVDNTEAKQAA